MTSRSIDLRLGLLACAVALFLILIGIPNWVSSPSNVRNIVLAPTFWPYVLSALTGLAGLALVIKGMRPAQVDPLDDMAPEEPVGGAGWLRLLALAVIMALTMLALPRLGMVWTAMLAFAVTAFLYRTRHARVALVCAVVVPLALYTFFAHVAGVAIPQGDFIRLP